MDKPAQTYRTIVTVFFAFMSALCSMMMIRSFNRSVLIKSDAIVLESKISDQWNYYQAKNIRLDIVELLERRKKPETATRLAKKKDEIFEAVRELESRRDALSARSVAYSNVGHAFSTALTLFQSAIMLVSLSLVGGSTAMLWIGACSGGVGFLIFVVDLVRFAGI